MKQDPSRPSMPSTREGAPGPDEGTGAAPAAERRALRVLLVEDLVRVQNLLRELIDEPGRFEVAGLVETEADAILQYTELQPDAVVIDLNLRSGTGLGVIMALRRLNHAVRPLLIVLTNHALPVLETACLNAGADYFLDKSRDFHKVRTLLERAWSNIGASPAERATLMADASRGSLTH
jgi:two-component system, OmpR family, response regulator